MNPLFFNFLCFRGASFLRGFFFKPFLNPFLNPFFRGEPFVLNSLYLNSLCFELSFLNPLF
ncbi:hypothetical protein HPHPH4_1430 [Helicobacter pylori Hp H-4]|nr:hypothetical protein HPHPH4_1430 [Helicobacter pylori Hp H-4]